MNFYRPARTEMKFTRLATYPSRHGRGGVTFFVVRLKGEAKHAAVSYSAFHRNGATHQFAQSLGDSQAEAGAIATPLY